MTIIKCNRCWKEIEQKGTRVLCIRCSNQRDKEIAKKYREDHLEEMKARERERYQAKKKSIIDKFSRD